MVLPDGTRSEPRRPASRRSVGIIALVALVGGALAIGALTTPDPEPDAVVAPTSTTSTTIEELERPLDLENFSVDQIAIGEPLEWERAAGIDDLYARQLVIHEGIVYLFGSTRELWAPGPSSTVVWRSVNGRDWESLGTVLETEHWLGQVSSTPQGLIAAEAGPSGMTLWRSDDAINWEMEVVPVRDDSDYTVVFPTAVAATSDELVVTSQTQTNIDHLLNQRILDMGVDVDLTKFGWGYDQIDGETQFVVYGPLGLHLLEVTADELGLTEEEVESVTVGSAETDLSVWVRLEDSGWQKGIIGETGWVETLTFYGSRLFADGYGASGRETLVSDDGGLNWEQLEGDPARPIGVVRWGDGFVGMHQGGLVDIAISEDGLNWERANLDEHFPNQIGWAPSALSAGFGGIALTAGGWSYAEGPTTPDPVPTLLTRDDVTLSLDHALGQIELAVAGEVHKWRLYSDQSQDGIEVDLETHEVDFHDRATGELLASFTIEELMEAERSYGASLDMQESFQAFVFSPDGQRWTIQDVEEEFGDGIRVMSLAVTIDAVVALVGSWNNLYGNEPGLEIWTAPVP